MIISNKYQKAIAAFLLLTMVNELFLPTVAMALTEGPNAKEASSFEPVATTNMVNMFDGGFTYNLPVVNIPGPDGGGYSMSLSYHSGGGAEDESSWVGHNWTMNPGAVNRQMRGLPDDYKENTVTKYAKTRPNWTAMVSENLKIEYNSEDQGKQEKNKDECSGNEESSPGGVGFGLGGNLLGGTGVFSEQEDDSQAANDSDSEGEDGGFNLSLGMSRNTRFNNYQGLTRTWGLTAGMKGMGSVGMTTGGGRTSFTASVDPAVFLKKDAKKAKKKRNNSPAAGKDVSDTDAAAGKEKQTVKGKQLFKQGMKRMGKQAAGQAKSGVIGQFTSSYGIQSLASFESSTNVTPYDAISYNWSANLQIDASQIHLGFELGAGGNFNIQANKPELIMKGSGYMYNPNITQIKASLDSDDNSDILSDYYVEKDNTYGKKDYFIGIPFNNSDNFSVSGEGIGGGFRLHQERIGHYYPNFSKSKTKIRQLGFELAVGVNLGLGINVGFGSNKLKVEDWNYPLLNLPGTELPTSTTHQFDNSKTGFMLFNGDMGSQLRYTSTTEPQSARIMKKVAIPSTKRQAADLSVLGKLEPTAVSTGASSYIQYNMYDGAGCPTHARLEKRAGIYNKPNIEKLNLANTLFEMAITNESGVTYTYGLPVYTKNEKSLSIGIEPGATINDRYLAYQTAHVADPMQNTVVSGESRLAEYANTFLVTGITTSDYVDIGSDGPDEKDFGGWTSFDYRSNESIENTDTWYGYRTPYTGLLYDQGQISNKRDDMGSVTCGEKQAYYLKTVETKTHVAFFITNETDGSDEFEGVFGAGNVPASLDGSYTTSEDAADLRYDGLGADKTDAACSNPALKDASHRVEKLEKIVVYSKDRLSKPLQTVHFEYDYSLVSGIPNTLGNDADGTSGKLTLKKVWFESEGVVNSKIAPYEFEYDYFEEFESEVEARYPVITAATGLSDNEQNPPYKPYTLDSWGNYQDEGDERHAKGEKWLSQKTQTGQWDPAAWQLKQIGLPSGGKILVQYEQKDYKYVQDRDALAMVSLLPGTVDDTDPNATKYFINTADLGLSVSEKAVYVQTLKDYFSVEMPTFIPEDFNNPTAEEIAEHEYQKKRIMFKFLYALKDYNPGLDECKSEYMSGYTVVNNVAIQGGEIYLSLGSSSELFAAFNLPGNVKKNIPKHMCYDYVLTQKGGFLENNNCTSGFENFDDIVTEMAHTDFENHIKKVMPDPLNGNKFRKDVVRAAQNKTRFNANYSQPSRDEICLAIDEELSYLRLPIPREKKGGGVRVKGLYMYDAGLANENGDAVMFGSEYIYELEDGTSSGVATNEPTAAREENALVNVMPSRSRSLLGKIVGGESKQDNEGVLGSSLLPGPSVGHARVVVRGIHSGKTGNGFQVHEFYTTKDYPFDMQYDGSNGIDGRGVASTTLSDNKDGDWLNLPLGMFNYSVKKRWVAQGYRFVINAMNGQSKRVSNYGGEYDSNTFNDPTASTHYLSTSTEYTYFEPGEQVPMLNWDNAEKEVVRTYENPGVEEDMTMFMRSVKDKTMDLAIELDVDIGLSFVPPIFISVGFKISYDEKQLNMHSTSKVLKYPAIVKGTKMYQDGVEHETQYLAFNKLTGKPMVVRTADGYDGLNLGQSTGPHNGSIYKWTIPAHWGYADFDQKVKDPNTYNNQLTATIGEFTSYGNTGDWLNNKFSSETWDPYAAGTQPSGVLSASMQVMDDNWFDDTDHPESDVVKRKFGIEDGSGNLLITSAEHDALNAKWKTAESYVYKAGRTSSDHDLAGNANARVYNSGVLDEDVPMFNWDNGATQTDGVAGEWVKVSTVTKYSPHGSGVEEKNILDIFSAVKFDKRGLQPVMVAKNSKFESIRFESFEEVAEAFNGEAHSGRKALNYRTNEDFLFVDPAADGVELTTKMIEKGGLIKVWLKSSYASPVQENPAPNFSVNINNTVTVPFSKVASSGEWSLFEAEILDWASLTAGTALSVKLEYTVDENGNEQVFVDDFRLQPYESEATCYVYDMVTYQLLTQFDDQHFGVFYQYNDEGKLVRKMIETERGMKTLQETQYNTPVRDRNLN